MINDCYIGDVRDGLRAMIAVGVRAQTCVTSPPYWGLRDYGTAEWEGGDVVCNHAKPSGGPRGDGLQGGDQRGRSEYPYRDTCGKCSATRVDRQLGLEPTIAEYVANMVEVFGLVRDVLADDGTLWLNLGDSYAASRSYQVTDNKNPAVGPSRNSARANPTDGLKPKDLCGIPWRVAFALQADGWYLRQDIIWAKPNPMPESVTDRCTKSHEYIFLLSKRERYYFDAAAIAEPVTPSSVVRFEQDILSQAGSDRVPGKTNGTMKAVYRTSGNRNAPKGQAAYESGDAFHATKGGFTAVADKEYPNRNKRSVWTVTTRPYSDAHFATFPPKLIEPCVLAGSRVGDIVLDPFMGSGTVGQVAQSLGRRWVGTELNPKYATMQSRRTAQSGLELHP